MGTKIGRIYGKGAPFKGAPQRFEGAVAINRPPWIRHCYYHRRLLPPHMHDCNKVSERNFTRVCEYRYRAPSFSGTWRSVQSLFVQYSQ